MFKYITFWGSWIYVILEFFVCLILYIFYKAYNYFDFTFFIISLIIATLTFGVAFVFGIRTNKSFQKIRDEFSKNFKKEIKN